MRCIGDDDAGEVADGIQRVEEADVTESTAGSKRLAWIHRFARSPVEMQRPRETVNPGLERRAHGKRWFRGPSAEERIRGFARRSTRRASHLGDLLFQLRALYSAHHRVTDDPALGHLNTPRGRSARPAA